MSVYLSLSLLPLAPPPPPPAPPPSSSSSSSMSMPSKYTRNSSCTGSLSSGPAHEPSHALFTGAPFIIVNGFRRNTPIMRRISFDAFTARNGAVIACGRMGSAGAPASRDACGSASPLAPTSNSMSGMGEDTPATPPAEENALKGESAWSALVSAPA